MRSRAARLLVGAYGVLLHVYPGSFRDDFGAEMRAVFAEAAAEAAGRGWRPLLGLVWREIRDWSGAVVRAHGRALREGAKMDAAMEDVVGSPEHCSGLEDRHGPVVWREALPAGLPHALVALLAGVGGVAGRYGGLVWGPSMAEIGVGGALALATVTGMAVAWRRRWPRWSASWFLYAYAAVALPLGVALARWQLPLGSWRLGLLLPDAYAVLMVPFLLAMMVLVVGLRNRLRVLLTVVPLVVVLWQPALAFTRYPMRTVVSLVAWLAAGLAAVLIARAGSVRRGVGVALGLSLLVGLAHTYVQTFHARFPPDAPAHYHLPPTALDWWNRLAPGVLASAILILEPLLVRRLSVLSRRRGRMGRLSFRLSLAGLMLLLAADLTASWLTPSGFAVIRLVRSYGGAKALWFTIPTALGGLLSVAGVLVVAATAGRGGRLSAQVAPLLLVFVLTVLPITAALPLASGFWDVRTIPRVWGYVVGLSWLAAGMWLVIWSSGGRVSRATA